MPPLRIAFERKCGFGSQLIAWRLLWEEDAARLSQGGYWIRANPSYSRTRPWTPF